MKQLIELFILWNFRCLQKCFNNSKKKRKMIIITKEKIEDQFEFFQYLNNANILKNLNSVQTI